MKKVFFENSARTHTTSPDAPLSSQRDASQVSSRWKEVSEKKSPSQGRVERKRPAGQQPKSRTHLSKDKPHVEFNEEEEGNASPFDLFGSLETQRNQKVVQQMELPEVDIEIEIDGDDVTKALFGEKESGYDEIDLSLLKTPKDHKFVALHEDMTFMAPTAKCPSIAAIHAPTDGVQSKISPKTVSLIEELINKIVDEVNVLKLDGRTETTITLKHPPMFSGAQVTITEFDSAKNELNIKFENLSQQAHELISTQANLDKLQSGLQQKGYNVHIVTANTEIEQPEHVHEGYNDRDGSDKRDDHQQHSRQGQEDEN